jgi:hypothetical protein
MHMKIAERFAPPSSAFGATFACRPAESFAVQGYRIRGDVFFTLRDTRTGAEEKWEKRNLVVMDASIIIARLMKDNSEPPKGVFVLGVGTGDSGWDPMNPPSPTITQRALYSEITRKTFSQTQFVDGDGVPVAYPTKIVDFTTTFTESEAVGPLVEMGLIGGNISTNGPYDPTKDLTQYETLVNYLTFPVINKPATSTLEIVWRLTF